MSGGEPFGDDYSRITLVNIAGLQCQVANVVRCLDISQGIQVYPIGWQVSCRRVPEREILELLGGNEALNEVGNGFGNSREDGGGQNALIRPDNLL